jgi:hypothetical protein
MTMSTVRALALALPAIEEGTSYGGVAFKLRGKLVACQATNKDAEPGTLVVMVGFAARDELIEAEPRIYYTRPHYVNYGCVLVRLKEIQRDALRDLLLMGTKYVSEQKARRKSKAR